MSKIKVGDLIKWYPDDGKRYGVPDRYIGQRAKVLEIDRDDKDLHYRVTFVGETKSWWISPESAVKIKKKKSKHQLNVEDRVIVKILGHSPYLGTIKATIASHPDDKWLVQLDRVNHTGVYATDELTVITPAIEKVLSPLLQEVDDLQKCLK